MTAASQQITGVSFRGVQILALDDTGYPVVDATTEYAGLRVIGAKALTLDRPEWETLHATGDDVILSTFRLPPTEAESGELRIGALDMTAEALLTGVPVATQGEGKWLPSGMNIASLPRVCLLAWREAKSVASGDVDRPHYQAVLIPSATLSPMGGSFEERSVGERTMRVAVNIVSAWPWGTALVAATDGGTTVQSADGSFEYVPRLCSFVGDGTVVEFTFGREAVSTDKIVVYVDGVETTSGITVAVDSLTFSTAPADGAKIVVMMEVAD
ncbi:MAG: hypothetical protein ACP5J4_11105 [Anaerolineae bacterium]